MKHTLVGIIFLVMLASCRTEKNNQITTANAGSIVVGGKLYTAVWMQRAAEYKALCEQAYNLATAETKKQRQPAPK